MKANPASILEIFEKKMRLEVPLFQRQYVWNRIQHWEPLWEDISRKFTEYLEGRKDAPVHFLGAMVLDQKQTPTTHVEKRQVIDGQQRLTTLQIFLAVFRDYCRAAGCEDLAKECEPFTFNKGMMAEPKVDRFKLWPTQLDRAQFADVLDAGSRIQLEKKHPQVRQRYARKPLPRPRMVESYLFFYDQLTDFFEGSNDQKPIAADVSLATRLEECFQVLRNALQVVVIDLEQGDDAQVIFETLNARGEPLLPADLLRNFIFLRAARQGESQEALYDEYWRHFDDPFWRVEVKQGRLTRPRSDLFLQHFLSSRRGIDIPVKHLFVEYKFWIERDKPFHSVRDELRTVSRQGNDFRRIIEPKRGDILYELVMFLDAFDIRTSYPLLLAMLDAQVDETTWMAISKTLESYLLRRAVCNLETKNYNRIFLALTRNLRQEGFTHQNLVKHLSEQTGESAEWPSDRAFEDSWNTRHVYQTLNNPKIVHILKRLNDTYAGSKMENIAIEGQLTIEHILPQRWIDHWPLSDGTRGLTITELWETDEKDPRAIATRRRNAALQTFGNLTILTQSLNSAASHSAWKDKKPDLLRHSLLPINQQLHEYTGWNEDTIAQRSQELLKRALRIWPRN